MVAETMDIRTQMANWEAATAAQRRLAVENVDTRMSGVLKLRSGGFTVHIDREVSLRREVDGSWLLCLYRTDAEAVAMIAHGNADPVSTSMEVADPTISAFLDAFVERLAHPTGKSVKFPAPAGEDAT